jgi:hypothetical protein
MLFASALILLVLVFIDLSLQESKTKPKQTLAEFETQLKLFEENTDFNLVDTITLFILYFLKNDKWKQGGERESLKYANAALSIIERNHEIEAIYQNQSFQELRFSLKLHQIKLNSLQDAHPALDKLYTILTNAPEALFQ